jgi:hypothetical protein
MIKIFSIYLERENIRENCLTENGILKLYDDYVFEINDVIYKRTNNIINKFGSGIKINEYSQEEFLYGLYYLIAYDKGNYNIKMLKNEDLSFYLTVIELTDSGIKQFYNNLINDNSLKEKCYFNVNVLGGSEVVDAEQLARFIKYSDSKPLAKTLYILPFYSLVKK